MNDGHCKSCHNCGTECSRISGNPSKWPICLPVGGMPTWFCTGCVASFREANERLREALEPFAKIARLLSAEDKREGWEPLDGRESMNCQELAERGVPDMILMGDLRRAQKALEDTAHGRGPVPEAIAPAKEVQGQPDETSG